MCKTCRTLSDQLGSWPEPVGPVLGSASEGDGIVGSGTLQGPFVPISYVAEAGKLGLPVT